MTLKPKILSYLFLAMLLISLIQIGFYSNPEISSIDHNYRYERVSRNQVEEVPIITPALSRRTRGNEPVSFVNVSVQANISQFNGNYFAWADYNNDGYQDLLVNGKKLLRNNGPPGWNFTDITKSAKISYSGSINVGVWGDWNNDRYIDFYAAGGGWTTNNPTTSDVLWKNTGPPEYTFEDVTIQVGDVRDSYPSVAAGWGDYDNDGFIDLYVANYENSNGVGYPDTFWRNNGDGTFMDMSGASGITSGDSRPGRGVAWCDYNNDGWLDMQIANYRLRPNTLWRNNHDGTFIDVGIEAGTAGIYDPDMFYDAQAQATYGGDGIYGYHYGHTIGSAWGDFNNDGNMDLWDSNLVHKYIGPSTIPNLPYDYRGYVCDDSKVYLNKGGPKYNFEDIRESAGIPLRPIGGSGTYQGDELWSGVAMGDYDNDGDLDVFVPQIYDLNYAYSLLYRNNNDGTFTDVAQSLGLRCYNTYGAAWCDFNNDGFLDLVTGGKSPFSATSNEIHLFKNNGNKNNWLKLELMGGESNQAGIGAKVKVTTNLGTQYRQMEGGMGSHSQQNSLILHFGLGTATNINSLEILWPTGKGNIFTIFPINKEIEVAEELDGPDITDISWSKDEISEDDNIEFDATAVSQFGPITKYEWDLNGDNIFDWSSTKNAKTDYNYTQSGIYYAKLRVWDNTGNYFTEKSTDFITVNNIPPTALAGDDITAYEDEILFFNSSQCTDTKSDLKTLQYNWSFGDETFTGWINSTEIQYSYQDNGNYEVTLAVKDNDDEINTDTRLINIENKLPSCELLIENDIVKEDSRITFNTIVNDTPSDLPYLLWFWDFGDGNKTMWSLETNIKHTYTYPGIFTVRITIRDDDWPSDINYTEKIITVYNMVPECIVEVDSEISEDEKAYFYALGNDTPSDMVSLEYLWDYADGTTSGWLQSGFQNTSHVYTKSGIYQTKLILRDNDQADCIRISNITVYNIPPICSVMEENNIEIFEDETIVFSGSGSDTKSDQKSLMYNWDFGVPGLPNTTWSSNTDIECRYFDDGEYIAILTVRDDDFATANATVKIRVKNVPPTPRFLISESTPDEDELVVFDASDTEDTPSDLEGLNFTWDFGDDSSEQYGKFQKYVYTLKGKYRVKLKVKDDNNIIKTVSQDITVKNVKPKASIETISTSVIPGIELTFNAKNSKDSTSDMESLTYSWDFGDKKKGNGKLVKHIYNSEGRYKVTLIVTDNDGSSDTDEVEIKVTSLKRTTPKDEKQQDNSLLFGLGIIGIIFLLIVLIYLIFIYYHKIYILQKSKNQSKENGLIKDDQKIKDQQQQIAAQPSPAITQKPEDQNEDNINKDS